MKERPLNQDVLNYFIRADKGIRFYLMRYSPLEGLGPLMAVLNHEMFRRYALARTNHAK